MPDPQPDPATGKMPWLKTMEELQEDFWSGSAQGKGILDEVSVCEDSDMLRTVDRAAPAVSTSDNSMW